MRKLKLSPHVFDKMTKLRYLYFHDIDHDFADEMTKLRYLYFRDIDGFDRLPQWLQSFSTDLRYLHWMHCPLKSFPEKFSAENLVILNLSYSLLEKLWCGVQVTGYVSSKLNLS
jgi:hypothetical protein